MSSVPLTTRIPIKDRNGHVIGEKEVATYAGLLARAHEEGLKCVRTELVQAPEPNNGGVAIVLATVETTRGTFTGIGDANPDNVNARIAPHLLRMAETRAKARALRDAVNIGMVALEELGGDEEIEEARPGNSRAAPRPALREVIADRRGGERPSPRVFPRGNSEREATRAPVREEGREAPMTENQRRWLYRFLAERGFEGSAATEALCRAAEVDEVGHITKGLASQLIDAWKQEGSGHAA